MERAFLLILEFDGTDFCGWQRQAVGRSVQSVLEDKLAELAGSPRKAVAAGRTDAGVHALGLPVSVLMPERWTAADLLRALNALLPRDVAVRSVRAIRGGTDARHAALGRRYQYHVGCDAGARSPFRVRGEWALSRPVSLEPMTRAAATLIGEFDFRAFAAVGEPKPHYRCRVVEAHWESVQTARLRFTIAADRFLYHMVRLLVGTMVDIGLGRRPESDMTTLLRTTHNADTSAPAPAAGLTFVSARYPDDYFLAEQASW